MTVMAGFPDLIACGYQSDGESKGLQPFSPSQYEWKEVAGVEELWAAYDAGKPILLRYRVSQSFPSGGRWDALDYCAFQGVADGRMFWRTRRAECPFVEWKEMRRMKHLPYDMFIPV